MSTDSSLNINFDNTRKYKDNYLDYKNKYYINEKVTNFLICLNSALLPTCLKIESKDYYDFLFLDSDIRAVDLKLLELRAFDPDPEIDQETRKKYRTSYETALQGILNLEVTPPWDALKIAIKSSNLKLLNSLLTTTD